MFQGEQCGSCVANPLLFASSRMQSSPPLAVCSQSELLSSVFRHGTVYLEERVFLYNIYEEYGTSRTKI
jgi:hypothetical protein